MFPVIEVSISGMLPNMKYSISLEFIPMDNCRYKFILSKWINAGDANAHCVDRLSYIHPDSPSTGKWWMSNKVAFKKLRLTNNPNHNNGSVSVHSSAKEIYMILNVEMW